MRLCFPLGLGFLEQVEGDVPDDGEVLRTEAGPQPAQVVVKDHVKHPVEPVLDAPVGAGCAGQEHGIGGQ